MNILVTGGHGFIGSHLVEHLLDEGHRVRVLASPWGNLHNLAGVLDQDHLEVVRGDLTDGDSVRGVADGVEVAVHAAARVADYGRWQDFYRTNVEGTAAIVAECERADVRRFVLVSSIAVFRYTGYRKADARLLPRDRVDQPYARSKILAEDLVEASSLESVVARPGLWPFGPRDSTFAQVCRAIRRGVMPVVGDGEAVLNTAWVGNLVDGLAACMRVPGAAGRSYLIADDGMPTWNEVLAELARLLDAPPPRLRLPPRPVAVVGGWVERAWSLVAPNAEPPLTRYRAELTARDVHFSIEHARRELGWAPQVSWREGLRRSLPSPRSSG